MPIIDFLGIFEGHTEEELLAGVRRYAVFVRATGKEGTEYVKQAATFFGPNKAFLERWTLPENSAAAGQSWYEDPDLVSSGRVAV